MAVSKAVAPLIWNLSEQSVDGQIDGHQPKMLLVPQGKEPQ